MRESTDLFLRSCPGPSGSPRSAPDGPGSRKGPVRRKRSPAPAPGSPAKSVPTRSKRPCFLPPLPFLRVLRVFPVRSFRSVPARRDLPAPGSVSRGSGGLPGGERKGSSLVPPPGIHRVAKRMRRIFRIHKEPVLCLYFPDQSTENSTTRYSRSTTSGVRVKVYSGPLPTVNQPRSSPSLASHTMRQFSSTPDTRAARVTASP